MNKTELILLKSHLKNEAQFCLVSYTCFIQKYFSISLSCVPLKFQGKRFKKKYFIICKIAWIEYLLFMCFLSVICILLPLLFISIVVFFSNQTKINCSSFFFSVILMITNLWLDLAIFFFFEETNVNFDNQIYFIIVNML